MSSLSRRTFLNRGLQLPAAGIALWTLGSCATKAKLDACVDVESLTPSEQGLRQANHYVGQAPDPARKCSGCSFFTPDEGAGSCGTCKIFGGPANALGHCDSWAAAKA